MAVLHGSNATRRITKPSRPGDIRILYVAEYAPEAPTFGIKTFDGDGGYPRYHHEIWETLGAVGYDVTSSSKPSSALFSRGNVDYVFSLYNRMAINNSEILISAFCEYARLPYLGARPNIRALAEDKWLSKLMARAVGIPTSPGAPYSTVDSLATAPDFRGPYFVKNRFGAGSEDIDEDCLQDSWSAARTVASRFLASGMDVLVDQFAEGIDVTIPIVGGDEPMLLGFVHPRSDKIGNILTEDLKLDDPLGYEMFEVGTTEDAFLNDASLLWSAVGPVDYLRADYRFDPQTGRRIFLEFNICCFIGSSGAICLAAGQHGLSQVELLGHVVEYSLRRQSLGREQLQWVQ